ncbi:MAG: DUF4349 domain-containing protein [Nanoarchaeota archaeon]|nr:DUF4349 domain-containing protein [Nanoarchaeota archaeon]
MSIKKQLKSLKDNWLLILAVIVILAAMNTSSPLLGGKLAGLDMQMESAMFRGAPSPQGDFAPEVEERKVTKTAGLSSEVKRGTFEIAEQKLKSIVSSTGSFILNENVYERDTESFPTKVGSYTLKVETAKYDSIVSQLRGLGEVKSFNENLQDVTERYLDYETEIQLEKDRLARYEAMYLEADKVEDKIDLNDRIFDQERRIKVLEESLENLDKRIDYTTVYLSISEKPSGYAGIAFVKFSGLIRSLVSSINSLLSLLFMVLPWAVVIAIVWGVLRVTRKR